MKSSQDIHVIKNNTRIVAIPVVDEDTSNDWYDPSTASSISYVVSQNHNSDTNIVDYTDADSQLSVVVAEDALSPSAEKPPELSDVPDGTNIVRVKLANSTTEDFPQGTLYHECEIEDADGSTHTVMTGDVRVQQNDV